MAHVTVGCKLPHGLVLRVFKMVDKDEYTNGVRRPVKEAEEVKRATVNGWAHPQNAAPKCLIVDGAAITTGVDKEFWDAWLTQNKDSDIVKNGLIWAHEKAPDVEAQAKAKANIKSGLERMDPNKLPSGVKTADRVAA